MSLSYQDMLTAVKVVLKTGNVPNIVGEAGIGKSALVETVAQELQAKLYTTVVSLSEKGDLAIPVPPLTDNSFVETEHYGSLANVKFGYSETLVDIIKQAELHPDVKIIWFLDEFNRGTQAVQSELMNLVLQRQINSLKLPEQVQIVIAENPDSTMAGFEDSNYGVTAGDTAIKDRTVRLVLRVSASDWLSWARANGQDGHENIHPLVQAFVEEEPDMLSPKQHGDDLFPTPRAWQRVSDSLFELDNQSPEVRSKLQLELFKGDLGELVGRAFNSFVKQQGNQLTPESILASYDFETTLSEFSSLDEVQKQQLLKSWLTQVAEYPLDDSRNADYFQQLLKQMSPDGQYVVIQTVGQIEHLADILKPMFSNLQSESVASLYRYFGKIATRNDAGDDI